MLAKIPAAVLECEPELSMASGKFEGGDADNHVARGIVKHASAVAQKVETFYQQQQSGLGVSAGSAGGK